MPNKFPLWKNLVILLVVVFGFVYAAPNLYPPDPAIQLSGQSGAMLIDQAVLDKAAAALEQAGISIPFPQRDLHLRTTTDSPEAGAEESRSPGSPARS